jgi:hypothetical protein
MTCISHVGFTTGEDSRLALKKTSEYKETLRISQDDF